MSHCGLCIFPNIVPPRWLTLQSPFTANGCHWWVPEREGVPTRSGRVSADRHCFWQAGGTADTPGRRSHRNAEFTSHCHDSRPGNPRKPSLVLAPNPSENRPSNLIFSTKETSHRHSKQQLYGLHQQTAMSYYYGTSASTSPVSTHSRGTSYGGSRPSSVSPQFSQVYPVFAASTRARFDASRGFELEDDLEFCPQLAPATPAAPVLGASSYDGPDYHRHGRSGRDAPAPAATSTGGSDAPEIGSPAARVRRAIEIVNPATGLRVASPPTTPRARN